MKRLFWKEWRENWLVVVCMPLLLALYLVGFKLYSGPNIGAKPDSIWLVGLCALAAIIIGAGLFAREIGNETLSFLLSQPLSRRRVWTIKSLAGLGVLTMTMLTTGLVWSVLYPLLFGPFEPYQQQELNDWGAILLAILACFILSLAVSTLMDRSLAAAGVALAVCVGLCIPLSFLVAAAENLGFSNETLRTLTIIGLSLPAFIAVSYRTFTRGESLRTPRRFVLAGTACAIGLAIAWTPPFAAYLYLSRFHPTGNAVTTPSVSPNGRWIAIRVLNRRIPPPRESSQLKGIRSESYLENHLVIEKTSGSEPRFVLPGGQPETWSADGRYLVYWQYKGLLSPYHGYRMVLVETANGRVHSIDTGESALTMDVNAGDAAFSPNGRWLAVRVGWPYNDVVFYDLRQLSTGAGKLRPYSGVTDSNDWHYPCNRIFEPIENDAMSDQYLAWSSDSRFLYYEGRSGDGPTIAGDGSTPDKNTLLLKAVDVARLRPESDWNNYKNRAGEYGDYTLCSLTGASLTVNLSRDPHRALVATLISRPHGKEARTGKSVEGASYNEAYVIDLAAATQAAENRDPEQDPPTEEKWLVRWGRPLNVPGRPLAVAWITPDGRYASFPMFWDSSVLVYETARPDIAVRKLPMKRPSMGIYSLPDGHSIYLRQQNGHWAIVDFASGARRQLSETGSNPLGIDAQGHLLFCDKRIRNVFRPGIRAEG